MADFQYLSKTLPGAAFRIMRSILQYISSSAEMLLKYRGKLSVQQNSYSKITPKLPYNPVNKRMRLFQKQQGFMRLRSECAC